MDDWGRIVQPGQTEQIATRFAEASSWVLHTDAQVIVVNKPPGIAVIPGRGEQLADALRGRLQEALDSPLWVVHRIDRDTSGVVVLARDADTHRHLCTLFEHHRVDKTYWALAAGLLPESGDIAIALHAARKSKMRPALAGETGALAAQTGYRLLQHSPGPPVVSVLEVKPRSGRQHQIRVHLRAVGAPLHGDTLYGSGTLTLADAAPRLALHAWRIAFEHPRLGPVDFEAPLPADLLSWLSRRDATPATEPGSGMA